MRIRSIKPEFWRSEDIAKLDWHDRLLFIGLWSYVDDNGVGRDVPAIITADLFALDGVLSESSVRVQAGLNRLHAAGLIDRYVADGKRYLHIRTWKRHQKINRPSPGRYPLPDANSVEIQDTLSEDSVSPHDTLHAGTGEQGNRGTGEKDSCSSGADAPSERVSIDDDFASWYANYPRKVGRGQALKAYRAARKKVDHQTLIDRLGRQIPVITAKGAEFTPHPATWLNGERWDDDHEVNTPTAPHALDPLLDEHGRYRDVPAHPTNPERWEDEPA